MSFRLNSGLVSSLIWLLLPAAALAQENPPLVLKTAEEVGIPPIIERIENSPADIPGRFEEAVAKGPEAIEALVRRLQTEETNDSDGRRLSTIFYTWFGKQEKDAALNEVLRARQEKVIGDWEKALPDSANAKLARGVFWTELAWDARSRKWAGEVSDEQWKEFAAKLVLARKSLEACAALQDVDPAWSVAMMTVMMGEGDKRAEFEELTDRCFRLFPECESLTGQAFWYLAPRWGGSSGEWEPWFRGKLKGQPEDVKARAYARAIIHNGGKWYSFSSHRKEMIEPVKLDRELIAKGIALLYGKYPDSPWVANGDAMIAGFVTNDDKVVVSALQRAKGRLDLRVWDREKSYERVINWVIRKRSKEK